MSDQRTGTGRRARASCRLRVLGPVVLTGPAGPVELPEPARDLLGLLALRAGEPVPAEQLRRALVPAPSGIPERVRELAGLLAGAGLPGALATRPDGYLLRLPAPAVDAVRFARLLDRARRRVAAREPARAEQLFAAALALWPEPVRQPLDRCPSRLDGWAAAAARQLVQLRAVAVEERWECALDLAAAAHTAAGGPVADRAVVAAGAAGARAAATAVTELRAAVARHPLRARLWELLLVATYLSAGRGAAVAVEQRARAVFADQLGVAPGERLRLLAEAARRGDLADRWLRPPVAPGVPAPATLRGAHPAALDLVRGTPRYPRAGAAPARPAGPPARRLPVPLTALLGRDELLADVRRRLAAERLVTLTGPGGAGKTRLALALAHACAAVEPGHTAPDDRGVWFVDLSAVESPVRVPEAVAPLLGVRPEPGGDPVEALAAGIGAARVLLVLDNCEHVLTGCAELTGRLLARCPGLRVLATSRSALRLPGETVVAVPTLGTPAPGAGHTLAGLAGHPATRLFLDRARACSGRPLAEGEADTVARICTELDGLPLAIELAAARVPLLGPAEILDRLRADPSLLRSPDPTVPSRHRTLAAAVESSVAQLGPDARTLFERLGVVAAGFDADAARALVGPAGPDALAELLAASLVEAYPGPAVTGEAPDRYRMLMPIRRHALARLTAGGGEVAARQAHAWYCLALAERADPRLRGGGREHWLHRLRVEAANLRAAMRWLAEAGAGGSCHGDLRLAAALATYCRLEGNYREGHAWLAAALARHPGAPAPLRARAGTGAALLAMLLCDYPAAAEHARAARAACRAAGDRRGEARVELVLGSVARERARYAESAAHLAIAAALFAECGDEWGELQVLLMRGFTAWLAGDLDRAESRLRSGLRRCVRLADGEAEATALMHLGAVALYRGDADRATSLLDVALQRYAALGFPEGVGWAHNLRGLLELRARRPDRAAAHLSVSLATHRKVGDRWRTASVLEALAELARLERRAVRAARLLGAAARIRDEIGAPVPDCERPETGATRRALRSELGVDAFDAAYRYGRAEVLDALLAEPSPDVAPTGVPAAPPPADAPALPLGR